VFNNKKIKARLLSEMGKFAVGEGAPQWGCDARAPKSSPNCFVVSGSRSGMRIVMADTPAILARVHRLRYQVYCQDRGFENPNLQLVGMEQDRYDEFSLQSLVLDDQTGADVGAVRLVLPNDAIGLPSYHLAPGVTAVADKAFPRATTAEASRFLRATGTSKQSELGSALETMALMAAIVRMSTFASMTHVLALVTAPMLRLLRIYRLPFKLVSEPVEYNGLRYPAIFDLASGLARVRDERPEVWRILTAGGIFYAHPVPSL
jgi:N-acyl-L-homoserine lactone synthetase